MNEKDKVTTIPVPVDEYVRQVAEIAGRAGGKEAAELVIKTHADTCLASRQMADIQTRVRNLEDTKENIRGWIGFVKKNWQIGMVLVLLGYSWFAGGGKLEQKKIDETVRQVNQIKQAIDGMTSASEMQQRPAAGS